MTHMNLGLLRSTVDIPTTGHLFKFSKHFIFEWGIWSGDTERWCHGLLLINVPPQNVTLLLPQFFVTLSFVTAESWANFFLMMSPTYIIFLLLYFHNETTVSQCRSVAMCYVHQEYFDGSAPRFSSAYKKTETQTRRWLKKQRFHPKYE